MGCSPPVAPARVEVSVRNAMGEMIEASPNQILDSNATVRNYPAQITLQELFEAQVRRRPLQSAVLCDHDLVWGTSTFSYERLNEKANQLAHRLREDEVRPGEIVAILV